MSTISSFESGVQEEFQSLINFLESLLHSGWTTISQIWSSIVNIHLNNPINLTSIGGSINSFFSPYNFLWFNLIPKQLVPFIAPIALIAVGLLIEKHYISRSTVFANSIAINIFIYYWTGSGFFFENSNNLLVVVLTWYANIGLIMAVIAYFSYAAHKKNGKLFNSIAWAYSSLVIALAMIALTIM
jgi:hypothetical protein